MNPKDKVDPEQGLFNRSVTRREALTTTGKAVIGVVAAAVLGGIFVRPVMAKPATAVASINGGGTSVMEVPPGLLSGTTSFSMHATLQAGGSATGRVDCVDQHGSAAPGNVFGEVTSWSMDGDVVSLNVTNGKLIFPGPPSPGNHPGLQPGVQSFTIRIQKFGGAGVGHWTLEVPDGSGGWLILCSELLTSGQIVYNPA